MVDRLDVVVGRRAAVLQQVLDQIDAPARAMSSSSPRRDRSGRSPCRSRNERRSAGSSPTPAVCGSARCSAGEKLVCIAPHTPAYMRAEIEDAVGIEARLDAAASAASAAATAARKTSTAARSASGARTSVAWPPNGASAARTAAASAGVGSVDSQTRPPPQSKKCASARGAEPRDEIRRRATARRRPARPRARAARRETSASRTARHSRRESSPFSTRSAPNSASSASSVSTR